MLPQCHNPEAYVPEDCRYHKLNEKQLEEIGTERSQDRPINKIINKIDNLKIEKKELEKYEDEKYEIEKENNLIKKKINELKNNLEFLNKLKKVKNIYLEEKNKINIFYFF